MIDAFNVIKRYNYNFFLLHQSYLYAISNLQYNEHIINIIYYTLSTYTQMQPEIFLAHSINIF